jgi:hypothetical protein
MTDVISPAAPAQELAFDAEPHSQPRPIPPRKGPLHELSSPVNQNGSFDFDRVLKTGNVSKRSRRTRSWKSFYLVLRPNLLSIYKTSSEEKLHKQINLSDLTAVAALKDPKGRREYMFGLFSPARNYHFQANNATEARRWVEILSREAHLDEEEESMILGSPVTENPLPVPYLPSSRPEGRMSTSSPEPAELSSSVYTTRDGLRIPVIRKTSFQEIDYSGAEHASYSDFSDTNLAAGGAASQPIASSSLPASTTTPIRPRNIRNASQVGVTKQSCDDEERVIWHGHLLALKSKGGVRQWRKVWVVVRRKHVALYKSEDVSHSGVCRNLFLELTSY